MKLTKTNMFLLFVVIMALSSCTSTPTPKKLSDIISIIEQPKDVSVVVTAPTAEIGDLGKVYIKSNESQKNELVEFFNNIDLSKFELIAEEDVLNKSKSSKGEVSPAFIFEGENLKFQVTARSGNDFSYIRIFEVKQKDFSTMDSSIPFDKTENLYYYGPEGAIPDVSHLNDMRQSIINDKDDISCGVVTDLTTHKEETLIKYRTAFIKTVLDHTMDASEEYKGNQAYTFNIELKILSKVYRIDTKTGVFQLAEAENAPLYQLDDRYRKLYLSGL